jgi:murein hydrolase activator
MDHDPQNQRRLGSQPERGLLMGLHLWASSLLGIGLLCTASSLAIAGSEKTQLVEKYEESRKSVVEAEAQKRKVLGSLYTINQRMKKISRDKGHLTDELFQVQYNVKNIAKTIAVLEAQIEDQKIHLKRRLRALYKLSGEGYMGIIFSQMNPVDLDETVRFLKIVTDNDYQLMRSLQANIAMHKQQRDRLRGQIGKLVAIEKNIKHQEQLLVTEHQAKSKIVSELDREKNANIRKLKSLRNKSRDLALDDSLKASIFESKGQLAPPVQGIVVQDFGPMVDEKYRIRLSHKGWRYRAPRGSPVSSIFDGTVIHSDWVKGYGHTVIVDHGDHYYSLYSHITRVRVKTGDTLQKGQAFADAGPSVQNFGEGLYFEIRHFSEPENPANWITGKSERSIAQVDRNQ